MKRFRLITAAMITAMASTAFGLTGSASAVTGGTEDTANTYSNVGMIAFYESGGRFRCSATLVTPTVLLTAAHCTEGTAGRTIVNFDPVIARTAPSNIPAATDVQAGYTGQGSTTDVVGRTWYYGTAHTHPNYSGFTDKDNWNDVGVVVLDQPVPGLTPARIAPAGYLDQFAQPRLAKTLVTVVGYGTEVRKPEAGPQKPTPMSFPLVRRYTTAPGQKLTPQILQVNGNPNDTRGGGGSCFGDSGGPAFKDGLVVTVTSYGYTENCRYLDGLQRVDIAGVHSWLATFGVRP